jgi:hypothetical protein
MQIYLWIRSLNRYLEINKFYKKVRSYQMHIKKVHYYWTQLKKDKMRKL